MAWATFRKLLSDKPFTCKIPRPVFRHVTWQKHALRNRKANPKPGITRHYPGKLYAKRSASRRDADLKSPA
jgi:hypothetical protein